MKRLEIIVASILIAVTVVACSNSSAPDSSVRRDGNEVVESPAQILANSDTPRGSLGAVKDDRVPEWILSHTMWRRDNLEQWRNHSHWLFQYNHDRVIPVEESETTGYFAGAQTYQELADGTRSYMAHLVGSRTRFHVLIDSLSGVSDEELDKSKFVVRIATTEYRPLEWQKKATRELAAEIGISMQQIELTVPPQVPSSDRAWVKGETLNPIPRN